MINRLLLRGIIARYLSKKLIQVLKGDNSSVSESEADSGSGYDETSNDLIAKFEGNASRLIEDHHQRMLERTERSKGYINDLVTERLIDRSKTEKSVLSDYDINTKNETEVQRNYCNNQLSVMFSTRDDGLDLMEEHSENNSYYGSDSGEHSRVYNNIDIEDNSLKQKF